MPVVATNTSANTAINYLNQNSFEQSKSLSKLSSGSRIVSASDDAAGLAVASRIQADLSVMDQAARNVTQGRAVLQTADGALSNIGDILQRMKSLAAQSISGSVTNTERGFIDAEYQQLITEINAIETSTTFNGASLLDGSYNENFLVGPDEVNDLLVVDFTAAGEDIDVDVASLYGTAAGNLTTSTAAATEADLIDTGIDAISTARSSVGSLISRFEFRGDYLANAIENLEAAKSTITDVDIAAEQSNLVSKQVLTETAIAALAQANQMKQSLLSLVR